MDSLRHHLVHYRWLAIWLVGLSLMMRIVVPSGYMPAVAGHSVMLELCSGSGPITMAATTGHSDKPGEHGQGDMPCGFSGLSAPSLAGADHTVLALAIAFIVATVFRAPPQRRAAVVSYLRPPLRGPPIPA